MKCENDDAINDMVNISAVDDKIIEFPSSKQMPKLESKIYNVTSRDDGVTWGKCFISFQAHATQKFEKKV